MSRKGEYRIGTSGYQYNHWKGVFYPEDLPKKEWFDFYSEHFDTVEINNTFYRLPEIKTFRSWKKQAPKDFCYALKFSRFGTHVKRLKEPSASIRKFLSRAKQLNETLGPILVQLPPNWKPELARLKGFLEAASKNYRWAIEFRDNRWLYDEVYEVLKRHNAALCIHDMIRDHPRPTTTNWVYLRFHGHHYGGNYSRKFLVEWAEQIQQYRSKGLDVFAYFNNDLHGHAIKNAADLRRFVED